MITIYKKVKGGELRQQKRLSKGCWIDVVEPTESEVEDFVNFLKIPPDFITSALDEEERPRYEVEGGNKLFIFSVPFEENNNLRTFPLAIIITKNYFLTIHKKQFNFLKDFIEDKVKSFSTTMKIRFLLQILLRINNQFMKYIHELEKSINKIEAKLVTSLNNKEIVRLLTIQKTLTYFHNAGISNHRVFNTILNSNIVKLFEEDVDVLEDVIIENKQYIEMISNYNNIVSGMLDAYASIVSNNLNIVMKVLAVITIILSIPTIITSFYGMNVVLPLQNNSNAYLFVILLSFFSMFLLTFIFKKMNWL